MTALLIFNYKTLNRELDLPCDQIKEDCISINEMLVSRYQNFNKMTIEIKSWYAFQLCNNKLMCFSNIIKDNRFLIIDK